MSDFLFIVILILVVLFLMSSVSIGSDDIDKTVPEPPDDYDI